eukprot:269961-Alexandrium_andersonii.AAC.1
MHRTKFPRRCMVLNGGSANCFASDEDGHAAARTIAGGMTGWPTASAKSEPAEQGLSLIHI